MALLITAWLKFVLAGSNSNTVRIANGVLVGNRRLYYIQKLGHQHIDVHK